MIRQFTFFVCMLTGFWGFSQNWTGNVNADWNNPSNWTTWPLNGDSILIDPANYTGAAVSPLISSNSVFVPDHIFILNGATLGIQADLSVNGSIDVTGAASLLNLSSGTLSISGSGSQGRFTVSNGAAILQSGGLLQTAQSISVKLGGLFTLNSGTVNPLQGLLIGDGDALHNSHFDMTGGSLLIGQGLAFENKTGVFEPTFNMSGGTLSVGGDLSWFGVAPGSGIPRFIMSGGSGNINGNVLRLPASTVKLNINLTGTADLTLGSSVISLVNGDSIRQSGTSVITLTGTNNFSNNGLFMATSGSTVFNGTTILQTYGRSDFYQVKIQAGKSLELQGDIDVNGDFGNDGSFVPNGSWVYFNGTSPQTIYGSSATTFRALFLSNTNDLTLSSPITISHYFFGASGKINCNASGLLTILDNAYCSWGGTYVNGPLRKIGNDAFVFQIGKGNTYAPMSISAPASITSEFTAEYFDQPYSNTTSINSPLYEVSTQNYWTLGLTGSTDQVKAALHWNTAPFPGITNCQELEMAHWNGNAWNNVASVIGGNCTGSSSGAVSSYSALNSYGPLTVGRYRNVTVQSQTICPEDPLVVGTHTYTSTGKYIDLLTGSGQADSTVISYLTVRDPIVRNEQIRLCYGDSLVIGSHTYTATGVYQNTYQAATGCDSIVITTLNISPPIHIWITQTGISLIANTAQLIVNAQWIDCNNGNQPIPSATGAGFIPVVNGNYAVIVTDNGTCTDTSDCYAATTVDVQNLNESRMARVFPNPTPGPVTVETDGTVIESVQVFNSLGALAIESRTFPSVSQFVLDLGAYPSGIYTIVLKTNTATLHRRIVKG